MARQGQGPATLQGQQQGHGAALQDLGPVPERPVPEIRRGAVLRRRRNQDSRVMWIIRGVLLAAVAFALATVESTEYTPDRSRLYASFRVPSILRQRPVQVGDRLPDAALVLPSEADPTPMQFVPTSQLFARQRVLLLSTPMAFSPGCSRMHIPGFIKALPKLRRAGIDRVAVVAVESPFTMHAWAEQLGAEGLLFLADPMGKLAKSLSATFEPDGLGTRGRRYAMLLDDLVIRAWEMEGTGEVNCSSAETFVDDALLKLE